LSTADAVAVLCGISFLLYSIMESMHNDDLDGSLWDSPSKPEGTNKQGHATKPTYQEQQERDETLRQELESVRQVNEVIEGVIHSLRKAKDNMKVVDSKVPIHAAY
jgi:hypothetical protein